MSDNRNGLGVALAVIGGCVAFFALILVLIGLNSGGGDASPAVGFPIVMIVLMVVAVAGALGWRAVSRKRSDR